MTNLEGSSSRGGASRKTAAVYEPDQSVAGKRAHLGKAWDGPRHGAELTKRPREGAKIKASQYGYNQGKNQYIFQGVLLKTWKASQDGDRWKFVLFSSKRWWFKKIQLNWRRKKTWKRIKSRK